jgi:hypothetical protein
MLVELTEEQFQHAIKIGERRQEEALQKRLPDKYGFDGVAGLAIHIEGAAGELAVAETLRIPWGATVNTFKQVADLADNVEIRTRSKSSYDLIVRPDDKDQSIFILVLRTAPKKFNVVGWIQAAEAKQEKWLQTYGHRPSAYFVPQSALKPIETLQLSQESHGTTLA